MKILAPFVLQQILVIHQSPSQLLQFSRVVANCFTWIFHFGVKLRFVVPTASKRPPLQIIYYFLAQLRKQNVVIDSIRVDEDGALACSLSLFPFLLPKI